MSNNLAAVDIQAEPTRAITITRGELVEAGRPIPFQAAFDVWRASLLDLSPRTIDIYTTNVLDFGKWLADWGIEGVNHVQVADMIRYRAEWQTRLDSGEYKRSAVANRLIAVRKFLVHCCVEGFLRPGITKARITTYLKSPKVKKGAKIPVYLERDEIGRLRRAAANKRDKAIVVLAVGAGLRVSELVSLKVGDLKPQKGGDAILEVRASKGGKTRSFRIPAKVVRPVRAYLRETGRNFRRRADLESYLFQSNGQSDRLTRGRINQILAALVKRAKIDKPVTPHSLRHTFATHYCIAGGNPVALAEILGHASLDYVMTYVHLAKLISGGTYEAEWL